MIAGAAANTPGARKVWIAHNHPAGNVRQSDADREVTVRMGELLDGSGIEYQGSLVVGPGGHFASLELGPDLPARLIPITPHPRTQGVPLLGRELRGKRPDAAIRNETQQAIADLLRKQGAVRSGAPVDAGIDGGLFSEGRTKQKDIADLLSPNPPGDRMADTTENFHGQEERQGRRQEGLLNDGAAPEMGRPASQRLEDLLDADRMRRVEAIDPVQVTWQPTGQTLKEVHDAVLAEADRRYLKGQEHLVVNRGMGDRIWISKSGLRKAISGHSGAQKVQVVPSLPDLIDRSVFVGAAPDRRGRPNVLGYRYYLARADIGGRQYNVKLAIREIRDGAGGKKKFYDHEMTQVSEAAGEQRAIDRNDPVGTSPATASPESSIPQVEAPRARYDDRNLDIFAAGQATTSQPLLVDLTHADRLPDAPGATADPGRRAATAIPDPSAGNPALVPLGPRVAHVPVSELRAGIDTIRSAEDAAHVVAGLRKKAQEYLAVVVTDAGGKVLRVFQQKKVSRRFSVETSR